MSLEYDFVIIGGGVSGYFAVKELAGKGKVALISDEPDLPYDRPPLSKEFLRGEKPAPFFEKPDFYYSKGITVFQNEEAEKIEGHSVITSSGLRIGFRKALIATGGRPRRINVPGENKAGVYYLRTLRDAMAIRRSEAKKFIVIGGSFLGVEAAASLRALGKDVVLIEALPVLLSKIEDQDFSSFIERLLSSRGIEVHKGEKAESIIGSKQVEGVKLKGAGEIKGDAVLIAAGISPSTRVAESSGIRVSDGVEVDQQLRTSMEDVYAAGDVALIYNRYLGGRQRIEHWNNAQYTGQLAARNMLGASEEYDFLSTIWSDVFDVHVEAAGITSGYDEKRTFGSMDGGKFISIFIREGRIAGYVAVNYPWESLERLNSAIKEGKGASSIEALGL
ncbi:MAG: NAD(P)/FAD-dependent oxidoreductase [Nitrososphaeria archaeon]